MTTYIDLNKNFESSKNLRDGLKNKLGIETITFAHNSIILTKSLDEDLSLYNRPYRFSHSL